MTLFLLLVFAHFLCDYPLQGDFLARAKNHLAPVPGVPWRQALGAHAGIHAGAVYCLTGSILLALVEWVLHAVIDHAKCAGRLNFNQDQALHLACKFGYVVVLFVTGQLSPLFT